MPGTCGGPLQHGFGVSQVSSALVGSKRTGKIVDFKVNDQWGACSGSTEAVITTQNSSDPKYRQMLCHAWFAYHKTISSCLTNSLLKLPCCKI